jgi:CRISPR-associated protein Csm3
MELQFKGKYLITVDLKCETGLHIGGSSEGLEIGGVDNPVIKDPVTEEPYIPGSSLKGKLRHLMEWSLGKIEKHPKHDSYTAHSCGECDPCVIFGVASDDTKVREKAGPSRLTVRDAFLTKEGKDKLVASLGEDLFTEIKIENTLDRVTSDANPRPMERVPRDASFQVEMVFDVYRMEDKARLNSLFAAMHLLENSSLGGSGSRGHGKIKFENMRMEFRSVNFYQNGDEAQKVKNIPSSLKELVSAFDKIDWHFPIFQKG